MAAPSVGPAASSCVKTDRDAGASPTAPEQVGPFRRLAQQGQLLRQLVAPRLRAEHLALLDTCERVRVAAQQGFSSSLDELLRAMGLPRESGKEPSGWPAA